MPGHLLPKLNQTGQNIYGIQVVILIGIDVEGKEKRRTYMEQIPA
jgi:hypothetical protein